MLDYKFLLDDFFIALSGVPITLLVTLISLGISIPVGFIFAIFRLDKSRFWNKIIGVYVSFVRGTPMIVQIFIVYSSIPVLLKSFFVLLQWDADIYKLNPIWYAFIVFSLNSIAILSEIFRSALIAVHREQLEAAYSVGLSTFQAYREIIIPQLLVVAMPNLCNATTNLIKATSLGYAMSLQEITLRAKVAANANYNYVEAYIAIFLVYLLLCSLVEYGFKHYEKKLRFYKFGTA